MTSPCSNLINSGDVGGVIAQEYTPTWRGRAATPDHVLGNRRLGDVGTKLLQLTMNAWRTPERVVAADHPDQITDVGWDCRPADTATGPPAPVQAEAAPVPAHQRCWLEDDGRFEQRGEQAVQPDEDQPIRTAQPEPGGRGPLQHKQLLAEERHFGFASRLRSEQSDEKSAEQLQEVEHFATRLTHR